ncbi:hypothetical protein [Gardnerella pickettii]|uniref:LPXTG-motif protein cell wall anchor domain protein n=1 Tax=Gardnerella pickettii JCP7719 TaxID=1261061 RepID=S4H3M5_9BIFI|nr:hypothetical protein [Gardnerella pickettii]EPI50492.1 hypothetical protein HMPREF1576_00919 [Gardnerella pickettii JCP7719]
MLNKKAIAGIAAASIVVSCGFGNAAFADEMPEVPNNAPKPAPVTTPTVKPEDDIYGSGSEWDQLQNTENDYENYYDQKYNTHIDYNSGHGDLTFDPHENDGHDPNGNDTKPEIPVNPDEHKTDPQTPPTPTPKVDTTKEDAEFKAAQDLANQKAQNALLLKQIAEGSVKALQEKVAKATGAEKVKLQEQLENAQKIANSLSELNDKATSMVKAYTQTATIRGEVKALEGQVATAQAEFDKLAKEQTGPSGSEAYNKAAEELGKLQKQLKSKKNLLEKANKGVTKAEETLVKQETKVQEVQNPKKQDPQAPKFNVHDALAQVDGDKVADYKLTPADVSELVGEKKNTDPVVPPAPKPVTPTPKPVNPVEPDHTTPSNPSTPSTPSDDTPSSTPSVTTPSASTPAGASQSAPAAGVLAAPASVADLLPALKGMITVGANNVVVAGAVNRVSLNISNQAFLDRLSRDGSAKAYAFIYSSPRLLKGADGANYVTVRLVNGKPQFDAMFPAGYSGKHTVVLVDEQGNQLGWTNITVKSGVSGLPNSGVGVALTALAASVLAGAGAAFRKIRH